MSFCNSCTKKNSVTIIETVEEIKFSYKIDVNGVEIETNAYAAYCQTDTSEFIIIASKTENLVTPLQTQNFEVGDFFYYYTNIFGIVKSGFGGQALGEEITGLTKSIYFSNANINIESNDGEIVSGSSEGILQNGDNSISFPYSMNFTALIIKESDFCE